MIQLCWAKTFDHQADQTELDASKTSRAIRRIMIANIELMVMIYDCKSRVGSSLAN